MKIKVTIKSGSKAEKVLDKAVADKAAFREAVATGNVSNHMKQRGVKFATPVSDK